MVRHIRGGGLCTGLLTRRVYAAGDCRGCGGDGGWYEETDRGKSWVTCGNCKGSGSQR